MRVDRIKDEGVYPENAAQSPAYKEEPRSFSRSARAIATTEVFGKFRSSRACNWVLDRERSYVQVFEIMVKFQKQLEGQLVPEWREAYCNYKQLKRNVKRIKEHYELVDATLSVDKLPTNSLDVLKSLGTPLAALSGRLVNSPRLLFANVDHIMVHLRQLGPGGGTRPEDEVYETEVLAALIPMQLATDFFKSLDAQLNMVNRFYRLKEEEYNLRAHSLQLQMAALLDSRKALDFAGCRHSSLGSPIPVPGVVVIDRDDNTSGNDSDAVKRSYEEAVLSLAKSQLQSDEKNMRTAFVEFYRGLGNLKSFSALNMMAFTKILKKYDKVTRWNASLPYCRVVESSYFAGSNKILQLMDRVEDLFTQHLAHESHKQAMVYLRPVQRTSEFVSVSYLQGFFTGCSVVLFITLVLTIVLPYARVLPNGHSNIAVEPLLPVYSTVGLVLLHLYMYGWNMYLWQWARINYTILFEWTPQTELRCQEVLLLSSGLTSFWMLVLVLLNLYPEVPHGDLIPLVVPLSFLVILLIPFDVCYRSTRVVFLRCILRVISSPFYKVVLADFFLADQLCSQVTAMKNLPYISCYYFGGYFHSQEADPCTTGHSYQKLQYLVCMLPYWWRLMQCARRWIDERDIHQVINGGKYFSALLASLMKVAYLQQGTSEVWFLLFISSSGISTIYNLYWDIVMDWGLMQFNSVNPWLRNRLVVKHKCVYYYSMVFNLVLRLAWLSTLMHVPGGVAHEITDVLVAVLEVFRRGHWNFYRLEYEHLSNFEKSKLAEQMVPKEHERSLGDPCCQSLDTNDCLSHLNNFA